MSKHYLVKFTRQGMEPPMPFGRTKAVVCATSRDEAKRMVPASSYCPITASVIDAPVTFTHHCRCIK